MIERERAAIEAARRLLAAVDAMFVPSGVWDRPFFADVNCFMNEPESPRTLEESAAFFEAVETARDELKAALGTMEPEGPQWGWTEQGYKVRKAIKEWSSQTGQPTEPTPNPTGGQP